MIHIIDCTWLLCSEWVVFLHIALIVDAVVVYEANNLKRWSQIETHNELQDSSIDRLCERKKRMKWKKNEAEKKRTHRWHFFLKWSTLMIARINKLSFLFNCQTNEHDDWSQPANDRTIYKINGSNFSDGWSRRKVEQWLFMTFTFRELWIWYLEKPASRLN